MLVKKTNIISRINTLYQKIDISESDKTCLYLIVGKKDQYYKTDKEGKKILISDAEFNKLLEHNKPTEVKVKLI